MPGPAPHILNLRTVPTSSPSRIAWLTHLLGIPTTAPHRSEQWAAAIGALIGISTVVAVTHALLGRDAAVFLVPSLGATAVLVFAAPHSLFAQPWSIIGGNVLSGLVGVACGQWLPDPTLAAAAAVGLAIVVMHATRCIHPPGGATALAAVIGGPEIHQLGFAYALVPVGLNCLLLVAVGIAYNYPFAWRRYPASLMRYVHDESAGRPLLPDDDHIRQTLEHLKVVVDVSPEELREVIEHSLLLARKADDKTRRSIPLAVGGCYGSRRSGRHWSVREIVGLGDGNGDPRQTVTYRIVEGKGRHRQSSCSRAEFERWAGRELRPRQLPRRP